VASTASTRLWRTCKEAGRPFPKVSEDDVIDFMVMEAVAVKVNKEDQEAQKKREKEEWKKRAKEGNTELDKFRG
jgi:hypothetical protein